jgi:hypothetical protein
MHGVLHPTEPAYWLLSWVAEMSQICPASHRTRCDITPLLGFLANKRREKISVLEVRGRESSTDPYLMFLFLMRSPKTREKCTGRLGMFFDFIDIPT